MYLNSSTTKVVVSNSVTERRSNEVAVRTTVREGTPESGTVTIIGTPRLKKIIHTWQLRIIQNTHHISSVAHHQPILPMKLHYKKDKDSSTLYKQSMATP